MGYDQKYYKRHLDKYKKWENAIGEDIYKNFLPESILDLGCGVGSYLEGAKLAGCKKVLGVEFNLENAKPYLVDSISPFIIKDDITKKLEFDTKFDCVISFEVGEHINPDGTFSFIQNLTSCAEKYIIMTAAPPGQGGTGHINLMEKEKWINLIELTEFEYQEDMVEKFKIEWGKFNPKKYILNNLMIFKKNEKLKDIKIAEPKKREIYDNREDILSFLPDNSICAELGVYSGKFTYQVLLRHSPKKLYLVDPYWAKFGKHFWWNNRDTWKTFCSAIKVVQKYDKNKCVSFVIDDDISFLKDIKDNTFDWVYVDSTHMYKSTLEELRAVAPKMKNNGLISGHDFRPHYQHKHFGVARAITEWLVENDEYELYLIDNHSQWIIRKK